jgi:transposase InsO family protein
VIHRVIAGWQKKAEVARLCKLLGVSRSGYYAARERQRRPVAVCVDSVALVGAFHASGGSYGSRRLKAALRAQGRKVGRYRVRSLMRRHGIKPSWKRKFVCTTDSKHDLPIAENILDRQFQPTAPNRAWAADISYIRTQAGWLYLACVLDLYSRKVVGWAMAPCMPADLVCTALQMAIATRQPKPGLIVHTDRGSQYASEQHQGLLTKHGAIASMSRKGNCWDNAVMERFFLNLKMERAWRRHYANHPEAILDITDYIVNFYNAERLHSTLDYLSPNQFERCHA